MSKQYRYPGVTPFTQAQQHLFFGRDQDVAQLHKLVQREALVVLHGKSGLGKSSLLNAGLLPQVEQQDKYAPLVVRLGAYSADNEASPLDKTKDLLPAKHPLLDRLLPDESALWTRAKAYQLQHHRQPLLIFDQFEEIFSYPEAEIQAFQQDLAELLYTNMPLRYRRRLESAAGLSEKEEDLLEEPLEARILLAIRSDRLHLLDRMKSYFPNILRHSFDLQAFSAEDARAAIAQPAALAGDYQSPAYKYEEAALERLLAYLQDEEGRVEGILIQMLCEHYEKKVVIPQQVTVLQPKHLGDPATVVRDYYREKIAELAADYRSAARYLIEEGLVSEGDNGLRLSLHETIIHRQYGVNKPLLDLLVDQRLLRSEPFLRGGYTYELSHDRLLPAVIEARQQRLEQEAQTQRAAEAERLRAEAETERQAKEKATRQLRQVRLLLLLAVAALVVAGFLGYRANAQAKALEAANVEIEARSAEAAQRLADYEKAERERKAVEIKTLLNRATTYENLNQPELAIRALQDALEVDGTREDIRERLRKLRDEN